MTHKNFISFPKSAKIPKEYTQYEEMAKGEQLIVIYCTVHEIRIFENAAVVMFSAEIGEPFPPWHQTMVLIKQGADWQVAAVMSKYE